MNREAFKDSPYLRNEPLANYQPKLLISPHPLAPRFSAADGQQVLEEMVRELSSATAGSSEESFSLFKEAAYVNLFIFLKFIAGYNGPYDKLKWDIHLDMCNFRQAALEPGIT